jgi:hypothetical protein
VFFGKYKKSIDAKHAKACKKKINAASDDELVDI